MIYLLRHGLDDEKYVGGWSDQDLTPEGIKQIEEASKYIKENLKFDQIYSSDIKRAVSTAKIISKETNIKVEFLTFLRELNKGVLNGMEVKDAKNLYPEFFTYLSIRDRYLYGESMMQFYERIKDSLEKILSLDNSLIITHRGVINMIYFILSNRLPNMNKSQFGVTHASLHELDPVKKKIKKIEYENSYNQDRKEDLS